MIAEPFICLNQSIKVAGTIEWFYPPIYEGAPHTGHNGCTMRDGDWMPYADFERERLNDLNNKRWPAGSYYAICLGSSGFVLGEHGSARLIGYDTGDFKRDSESSRLLKRAEFLKAVCEKEGVDWLPESKLCRCAGERDTRSKNGRCGNCGLPEQDRYYTKGDSVIRQDLNALYAATSDAKAKGIDVVTVLVEEPGGWSDKEQGNVSRVRSAEQGICRGNCHDMNCHGCKSREIDELRKRDCDTKKEIEHRINVMFEESDKEEREWREALLDFLNAHMLHMSKEEARAALEKCRDLRRRFLS
jgi:hypothetical protein